MSLLTREQILKADDLPYEDVEVPEWGGVVRVRTLTGAERDAWEQSIITMQANGKKAPTMQRRLDNLRAKLVARCLIDDAGARLFTDKDIAALGQKSAAALSRVFEVAQRLNGLTENDVEELVENFFDGPNDSSISS